MSGGFARMAEQERLTRSAIRANPPDILLTNYKQLEFLLVRAADRLLFTSALRYLVLDELHSYRGALATEIACLIRRLKAHAGLAPGALVGIGTSATVAEREGGAEALARFATVLLGEDVRPDDVIGEALVPLTRSADGWVPGAPRLTVEDVAVGDDERSVVALAARLTGRPCAAAGAIAERIAPVLDDNAVVTALEEVFARPSLVTDGAQVLRGAFPDRAELPEKHMVRQ